MGYDRYFKFRSGDEVEFVPFGEIPVKSTDRYETYIKGRTRLDQLSYQYYGSSDYGWLILQANPSVGALEFNIPDRTELRIPYPLNMTLEDYSASINKQKKLYD